MQFLFLCNSQQVLITDIFQNLITAIINFLKTLRLLQATTQVFNISENLQGN